MTKDDPKPLRKVKISLVRLLLMSYLRTIKNNKQNTTTDMKEKIMKAKIESLYAEFRERYPYVSIDKTVVELFVRKFNNSSVHLLYDFVMSQGLEDEVEI